MCARVLSLLAVLGAAAFVGILGAASSSRAQAASVPQVPVESAQAVAEARHHAAVDAYARGHYREAIELFVEANRLRPSAALFYNVARSYEQLGDSSSALAWYRAYLRDARGAVDADEVARVIARLEKRLASKGVQQVTIISSPPGATVLIDAQPVGVAPWTGDIAPGEHSVDLLLRGYRDASQRFELLRARSLELDLALSPERPASDPERPTTKPSPEPVQRQPERAIAKRQASPAPGKVAAVAAKTGVERRSSGPSLNTVGFVALATAGAALTGAVVFEVLRHQAEDDAQHQRTQIRFAEDLSTMHARQTWARVLGGAGAALAVSGGVLLLAGARNTEKNPAPGARVALDCAPSRCSATLLGKF